MSRNNTLPPSSSTTIKLDKRSPITPIKILKHYIVSNIKTTTSFQYDNINEENNDNADWITVEPQSLKTNKRQNTSSGLSPKPNPNNPINSS